MSKCPICNNEVSKNANECHHCGWKVALHRDQELSSNPSTSCKRQQQPDRIDSDTRHFSRLPPFSPWNPIEWFRIYLYALCQRNRLLADQTVHGKTGSDLIVAESWLFSALPFITLMPIFVWNQIYISSTFTNSSFLSFIRKNWTLFWIILAILWVGLRWLLISKWWEGYKDDIGLYLGGAVGFILVVIAAISTYFLKFTFYLNHAGHLYLALIIVSLFLSLAIMATSENFNQLPPVHGFFMGLLGGCVFIFNYISWLNVKPDIWTYLMYAIISVLAASFLLIKGTGIQEKLPVLLDSQPWLGKVLCGFHLLSLFMLIVPFIYITIYR